MTGECPSTDNRGPDQSRYRIAIGVETHEWLHCSLSGGQLLLTKGDNNESDDLALYKGRRYLNRSQVVGRVQGFVPFPLYPYSTEH